LKGLKSLFKPSSAGVGQDEKSLGGEAVFAAGLTRVKQVLGRCGAEHTDKELLAASRESVGWDNTAAWLTTARFCAQHSELGMTEYGHKTTARDDLLGVDTGAVNNDRLYRALDQIGEQKNTSCPHLMQRYRQRFGVRFEFLLYGVTSTSFERGAKRNPRAQRRYARNQSCGKKQVFLGPMCTPERLPLSFEVFAGTRAESPRLRTTYG
jgi:hypothetical protein